MILVTGITGSGKSTTLAAMIDFMNRNRNDHIITIEDPIEFVHEDNKCVISQREVGQDSVSFAARAARRAPRGPGHHPRRRDARRRDDGGGAARGGDGPPRPLHAAHAERDRDRQPHHLDLPAASGGPDPRPARGRHPGHRLPAARRPRRRQGARPRGRGHGRHRAHPRLHPRRPTKTPNIPTVIAAGQAQYGMQTFDQSLLQLYREELITYETARDAATNPDDFDLKVKGILSTGEMTWGAGRAGAARPRPRARLSARRGGAATSGRGERAPGHRVRASRGARAAADARRQGGATRAAFDLLARKAWSTARADAAPRAARGARRRRRGRRGRARGTRLSRRRGLRTLVGPGARGGTAGRQRAAPSGAPRPRASPASWPRPPSPPRSRRRRSWTGPSMPADGGSPALSAGGAGAGAGPPRRLSPAPWLSAVRGGPGGQALLGAELGGAVPTGPTRTAAYNVDSP